MSEQAIANTSDDGTLRRWGTDPLRTDDENEMTPGPPCTQEEAEDLTDRARKGLKEFDSAMSEIVWRQAWKALGYTSAREYLLAELGSSVEGTSKTYSRRHILRLVRALEFISALQERLGDAAKNIDVSERELRGVPSHVAGEGFTNLIGEIVERTGEDPSADLTQEVVDEVIAEHRTDIERPQEVSDSEPEPPGTETTTGATSSDADWADDEEDDTTAVAAETAERRADAVARSSRFTEFAKAWRQLANALPYLGADLDAATDQELRELNDIGEQVTEAAQLVHDAREARDTELMKDSD